jgi:PAS domain-containing protein
MEFLSERSTQPHSELLGLMETLGRQVGQYTERRRADEAMRVSEAVKDGIVRTAMDATVGMDADLIYANPAALAAAGNSSIEELTGRATRGAARRPGGRR